MGSIFVVTNTVLIIGSAPDATHARTFDCGAVSSIVALNNAWRIREDWNYLVCPQDFPVERRPQFALTSRQHIVEYDRFVPANNAFGGIVYAGGTMAFTGAYWVLHALKPDILAFAGCDMVYDDPQTHFYGKGEADPLRDDVTLQSLEAKSNRLAWMAMNAGCLCVNLSQKPTSRLTFDRVKPEQLSGNLTDLHAQGMAALKSRCIAMMSAAALERELHARQFAENGDYWNLEPPLDKNLLGEIDDLWLKVFSSNEEA